MLPRHPHSLLIIPNDHLHAGNMNRRRRRSGLKIHGFDLL
ncbi:hypothetical protein LINPERPRIM_LOCUS6551 [Linum perenne]